MMNWTLNFKLDPLFIHTTFSLSDSLDCLYCVHQGLQEPKEILPGSFVSPTLPEEGISLEVQGKHLLTPNEVFREAEDHFESCRPQETH